jgi:adenine-specific DNA methylase
VALRLVPNKAAKQIDLEIVDNVKANDVGDGTVKRGSATCPCCGFTTPVKSVREQLKQKRGGAADARLMCVVTTSPSVQGRCYRLPTDRDRQAAQESAAELSRSREQHNGSLSLVPDEFIDTTEPRRVSVPMYGMSSWGDLFTSRQALMLGRFARIVASLSRIVKLDNHELASAVSTCLAFAHDRCADKLATPVIWHTGREFVDHVFARQAIPITWEFAEANVFSDVGWSGAVEWVVRVVESNSIPVDSSGHVAQASSAHIPMPDGCAAATITDPPYYYSVPYSHLADYFYVWLRRTLADVHPTLLVDRATPKEEECVQNLPHSDYAHLQKDTVLSVTSCMSCGQVEQAFGGHRDFLLGDPGA